VKAPSSHSCEAHIKIALSARVPGRIKQLQIFWEAAGLGRGPLSIVRTTEELLEGKVAVPVYKTEINERGNLLRWPRDTLYPQTLALNSPKSGGRSVGIVRSRTRSTEFSFSFIAHKRCLWLLYWGHDWTHDRSIIDVTYRNSSHLSEQCP
jgi:hypothetical protein